MVGMRPHKWCSDAVWLATDAQLMSNATAWFLAPILQGLSPSAKPCLNCITGLSPRVGATPTAASRPPTTAEKRKTNSGSMSSGAPRQQGPCASGTSLQPTHSRTTSACVCPRRRGRAPRDCNGKASLQPSTQPSTSHGHVRGLRFLALGKPSARRRRWHVQVSQLHCSYSHARCNTSHSLAYCLQGRHPKASAQC